MSAKRDWTITLSLVVLCSCLTWLLIRSEYFPDAASLYRIPTQTIVERFLKNENHSVLTLIWKGERVGSLSLRVVPGTNPAIFGSTQAVLPVLGQKPSLRCDFDARLLSNHTLEHLRLRGKIQELLFEIETDTPTGKVRMEAHGNGVDEKREFSTKAPHQSIPDAFQQLMSEHQLPGGSVESAQQVLNKISFIGSQTRIHRQQDWMDAYLLEIRSDSNTWMKIWIGFAGEPLKLDSSFGLSAFNQDFFPEMENK